MNTTLSIKRAALVAAGVTLAIAVGVRTASARRQVGSNSRGVTEDAFESHKTVTFPPGSSRPVLALRKAAPTHVRVGAVFDYIVTVENQTSVPLDDVTVHAPAADNIRIAGSSPQAYKNDNGDLHWRLGRLKPQQSRKIVIRARCLRAGKISLCERATFTSEVGMCTPVAAYRPELEIDMTEAQTVYICERATVTTTVRNVGTGPAEGVTLRLFLPQNVRIAEGRGATEYSLGTLPAGKARQVQLPLRASQPGTFTIRAQAAERGGDTETARTTIEAVQPELTVDVTCREQEFVDRTSDVAVSITNQGTVDARNVRLNLDLKGPARVAAVDGDGRHTGRTAEWTMPQLAPGQSSTFKASVSYREAGMLRVRAAAEAFCTDPVVDACETAVTGIAAILLEVIDRQDPVPVGGGTTYVITATNQGSAPGTNLRIRCQLEDNLAFVDSSGPTEVETKSGDFVEFAPLSTLSPGDSAAWRVNVNAAAAGDVRFRVELRSDQLNREVFETEATTIYE